MRYNEALIKIMVFLHKHVLGILNVFIFLVLFEHCHGFSMSKLCMHPMCHRRIPGLTCVGITFHMKMLNWNPASMLMYIT